MHARLGELLERLDDPARRAPAARLLHAVVGEAERAAHAPFSVTRLSLPGHRLRLLQLPSVFAPEQWSFTFYEGLRRIPHADFEGRVVAELGSGNGWISLALARFGLPRKVYGLDINPRAVLSARLNAHLDASAPDGSLLVDSTGKSLLDRIEFHVSDVLTWCRERRLTFDHIIGCIPQVLDPTLGRELDTHARSDGFLHALSNYCGRQGFVEDRFGLGLMARVLEESIELLAPGGKVTFNLGGRPGRALLRRLFERRGYRVSEIWRTRAPQAEDTDIQSLVEIEARTDHRFEFFLGPQSEESVGARTAAAFAAAGGTIYHSIHVYQGALEHSQQVKALFAVLRDPVFQDAHGAIDLAFGDEHVAEEKLSFLVELADWLARPRGFPYAQTAGLSEFREHLASYLASYFQAPVAPEALIATPTRAAALVALLLHHRPPRALIDRELATLLLGPELGTSTTRWGGTEVLEAPRSLELCRQLLERLRPGLLVVALTSPESQSLDSIRLLVETARTTNTTLVLDVSAGFELSSAPAQHPALRLLAEQPLPEHVTLLCGLVKDDVYRDLELSVLVSENAATLSALADVAELTYSRPPLLVQRYYARILADLLSFRIQGTGGTPRRPRAPERPPPPTATERPAALALPGDPARADVLRLDYGENSLSAPTCLRAHLLEAFARRQLDEAESDVRPELIALLEARFGLQDIAAERLHVAGGTAPLFTSLMLACAAAGGTLLLPQGAYGYFEGCARLVGASVRPIVTARSDDYKVTPAALTAAIDECAAPHWLYLNAPIVNPTGAAYSAAELAELLRIASAARVKVILDTVFTGLDHAPPHGIGASTTPGALARSSPSAPLGDLSAPTELVVLGGVSKELAAGGLRFGYGYASTPDLSRALAGSAAFGVPHPTLRFALKRTLAQLLDPDARTRRELDEQRALLARRAALLCDVLRECGWDPIEPQGGLFVVARPGYGARTVELVTPDGPRSFHLGAGGLVEALFATTGLLVNGPAWTGIPEHHRFVLSVPQEVFDGALAALRRFHRLVEDADRDAMDKAP